MAVFKIAYNLVMGHEGTYSNRAIDRGGETWKGIARKIHPTWQGWVIIDGFKKAGKINMLGQDAKLEEAVQIFYLNEFWNKMRLGEVRVQAIANEMFDIGVNMGRGTAVAMLQRSLNILNRNAKLYPEIKVDSQIGSRTLSTLNNHPNPIRVFNTLNGYQFIRYVSICESDPNQEENFNGWLSRVEIAK